MMRKPMKPDSALVRLETLCARSEQCGYDLLKKLSSWGIVPSDAEKILNSLADRRFFDDGRFAGAFVSDKFRFSGWGKRKIRQALFLKHIDADLIDEALETIDADEYRASLWRIIRNRAVKLPQPLSYDDKVRLARFAAGRGFEPDLIFPIINNPSLCQED